MIQGKKWFLHSFLLYLIMAWLEKTVYAPPGGLMPIEGRGDKQSKRPLPQALAALEPNPQYR
jgi:hypothetical protein